MLLHLLTLILQFDGSLRIPQDPNPEVIPNSISSSSILPLASCSAALLTDDKDQNHITVTLKGEAIQGIQLTSADVEYEGLILGLNEVINFYDYRTSIGQDQEPISVSYKGIIYDNSYNTNDGRIIVRGDCKTVIDQMNGISLPRKQRKYYNDSKKLIQQIEKDHNIKITFEHVSRTENELCDYACYKIIQLVQWKSVLELKDSIDAIVTSNSDNGFAIQNELPISKNKRIKFRGSQFVNLIDAISSWDSYSQVPISIRPYWMCELFFSAEQSKDYVAIRLIGEALIAESKRWKNISSDLSQNMELLGYRLVVNSLEQMNLRKEANKIANKSPFSVEQHDDGLSLTEVIQNFQEGLPKWAYSPGLEDYHLCPIWKESLTGWYQSLHKQLL